MSSPEVSVPVYHHTKRSEWGAALLTWERANKRGYLFEDGALRVIAEPYYHLMTVASVEYAELSSVFREQISRMSTAKAAGVLDPSRAASMMFRIEEQGQLLRGLFPEGFVGKRWLGRHRGVGVKKALKRHRDACVTAVQKALAAPSLAAAVADGSSPKLWADIVKLLETTDLAPPREVKALAQRADRAERGLTVALAALLDPEASEEAEFKTRFSNYVTELRSLLGRTPSWQLTTSLLALYAPSRYLCVNTTSLGRQRTWMGDSPIRSRKPNAVDYRKALTTATRIEQELQQLGLSPADLLDVYDFIRISTTPSAMRRLEALRQSTIRGAASEQKTEASAPPPASSPTASGDEDDVQKEAA